MNGPVNIDKRKGELLILPTSSRSVSLALSRPEQAPPLRVLEDAIRAIVRTRVRGPPSDV